MNRIFFFLLFLPFFVEAQIINTVAGNGTVGTSGDGGASVSATLFNPSDVAADKFGNIFITNTDARKIRKVNTAGVISTIAGNGSSMSYNGGPADSAFIDKPYAITTDDSGNIYFTTHAQIFKINTLGNIYLKGGSGAWGYTGDGGSAILASFDGLTGIAVDTIGNIYVADYENNVIRKITALGIVTTVAGNGINGFSPDGNPATASPLNNPRGVAVDKHGNILFAEEWNPKIRKVNLAGILSTLAGNGLGVTGCLAIDAQLFLPKDVCLDKSGNIFLCGYNNVIYRINSADSINIIAGMHFSTGFSGDGGSALSAQLNNPMGIGVDNGGNILVADQYNNRIRRIGFTTGVNEIIPYKTIAVYPTPVTTELTITASERIKNITITNILGYVVYNEKNDAEKVQLNVADLPTGIYLVNVNGIVVRKFVKD